MRIQKTTQGIHKIKELGFIKYIYGYIKDVCERLLERLNISPVTVQPSIDDKQVGNLGSLEGLVGQGGRIGQGGLVSQGGLVGKGGLVGQEGKEV